MEKLQELVSKIGLLPIQRRNVRFSRGIKHKGIVFLVYGRGSDLRHLAIVNEQPHCVSGADGATVNFITVISGLL